MRNEEGNVFTPDEPTIESLRFFFDLVEPIDPAEVPDLSEADRMEVHIEYAEMLARAEMHYRDGWHGPQPFVVWHETEEGKPVVVSIVRNDDSVEVVHSKEFPEATTHDPDLVRFECAETMLEYLLANDLPV